MYDIALCDVPKWYELKGIRPHIIKATNEKELKLKSKFKGLTLLIKPSKELFRFAVEKSLVDVILPDRVSGNDYIHHPRTFLNNVNAKLMNKNKVSLLFTIKELKDLKGIQRAIVWGRMKYEMWICIKKNVPIIISSGAENKDELVAKHSLLAFGELLGLKPEQSKKALYYVQEKILKRNLQY